MTLISNIKYSFKKNTEPYTRLYLYLFVTLWAITWYCSFRRKNVYLNTLLITITIVLIMWLIFKDNNRQLIMFGLILISLPYLNIVIEPKKPRVTLPSLPTPTPSVTESAWDVIYKDENIKQFYKKNDTFFMLNENNEFYTLDKDFKNKSSISVRVSQFAVIDENTYYYIQDNTIYNKDKSISIDVNGKNNVLLNINGDIPYYTYINNNEFVVTFLNNNSEFIFNDNIIDQIQLNKNSFSVNDTFYSQRHILHTTPTGEYTCDGWNCTPSIFKYTITEMDNNIVKSFTRNLLFETKNLRNFYIYNNILYILVKINTPTNTPDPIHVHHLYKIYLDDNNSELIGLFSIDNSTPHPEDNLIKFQVVTDTEIYGINPQNSNSGYIVKFKNNVSDIQTPPPSPNLFKNKNI